MRAANKSHPPGPGPGTASFSPGLAKPALQKHTCHVAATLTFPLFSVEWSALPPTFRWVINGGQQPFQWVQRPLRVPSVVCAISVLHTQCRRGGFRSVTLRVGEGGVSSLDFDHGEDLPLQSLPQNLLSVNFK